MNSFLKDDYEVPKAPSNYVKLEDGQNEFRAIGSAIVGYKYFNTDDNPVRSKEVFDPFPTDIKIDNYGKKEVKHFWAFVVIERSSGNIKILEITQKGIMNGLKTLIDNPKWGNPNDYDFTIAKTGEKKESRYTVQPSPKEKLTKEEQKLVKDTKVDINALYSGGDPFADKVSLDEPVEPIEGDSLDGTGFGKNDK